MPVPVPPVTPNPLLELTTYIPMMSALLGAAIGGTISWINLNRQFNQQKERDITQERKNESIAINAVAKEIENNCIQLSDALEEMKQKHLIAINYKTEDRALLLSQAKWDKHSDILDFTPEMEELLEDLHNFYSLVETAIKHQIIVYAELSKIISRGSDAKVKMEEILKQQKNNLKKERTK